MSNDFLNLIRYLTMRYSYNVYIYSTRKSHSIALRILNFLKIRNTQRSLFKLYGMAICLNLESLDREILQIKITLSKIFNAFTYVREDRTSQVSQMARIAVAGTRVRFPRW